MPRALTAAVSAQLSASTKRPVLLFELGLSSTTLYFATAKTNVVFPTGGTVYTAKTIQVSNLHRSIEGQIGRVEVQFDNTSRDMSAYASIEYGFGDRPLVIKRVYLDSLSGSSDYVEYFKGTMEEPKNIGRNWLPITAISGKALGGRTLQKSYSRTCNHIFGDARCNQDGLVDLSLSTYTISGNVVAGGVTWFTYSAVTGAVDDYWNCGRVKVGLSGTTYKRIVGDYDSGTSKVIWNIETPVTLTNSYRFELTRGCPKTWTACSGVSPWGPTVSNTTNYSGFIHIGNESI